MRALQIHIRAFISVLVCSVNAAGSLAAALAAATLATAASLATATLAAALAARTLAAASLAATLAPRCGLSPQPSRRPRARTVSLHGVRSGASHRGLSPTTNTSSDWLRDG